MKKTLLLPLFALCLLASPPPALRAEVPVWELDDDHTDFYFAVTHIYAEVRGRFDDYEGTVRFDPDNLEQSSMSFTIEVKSVDTGIGKRDRHLRSEDFFDASEYPEITFVSSRMTRGEGDVINVTGTLTIKDVAKEITVPMVYAGSMDHPLVKNTEVAGFNGEIELDRLEYGVGDGRYYEMKVVGKDVSILFTTEVMRKK